VYDSTYGVTCHWCRQKTLVESVTCTAKSCGERRMPVSFCRSCLLNRHGEDWLTAKNSGCWICPPCRGSCGEGCTVCCNCGPCRCVIDMVLHAITCLVFHAGQPDRSGKGHMCYACRKKHGLEPTGQVKARAIADGFDNVHDWLVFQSCGANSRDLEKRKRDAPWGEWLNPNMCKTGNTHAVSPEDNTKTAMSYGPKCKSKVLLDSQSGSCPGEAALDDDKKACKSPLKQADNADKILRKPIRTQRLSLLASRSPCRLLPKGPSSRSPSIARASNNGLQQQKITPGTVPVRTRQAWCFMPTQ
jgi:hypothetical protein